jgi:hypothetical protein
MLLHNLSQIDHSLPTREIVLIRSMPSPFSLNTGFEFEKAIGPSSLAPLSKSVPRAKRNDDARVLCDLPRLAEPFRRSDNQNPRLGLVLCNVDGSMIIELELSFVCGPIEHKRVSASCHSAGFQESTAFEHALYTPVACDA